MASLLDDTPPAGLLGIEAVLPAQFWANAPRAGRGEPERRLMLAVLQDALLTVAVQARRQTRKSRRLAAEARRWFASETRAHPFAFAAICDVLGLETSYIRAALRRLQAPRAPVPYRRAYAGRGRHLVERRRAGT